MPSGELGKQTDPFGKQTDPFGQASDAFGPLPDSLAQREPASQSFQQAQDTDRPLEPSAHERHLDHLDSIKDDKPLEAAWGQAQATDTPLERSGDQNQGQGEGSGMVKETAVTYELEPDGEDRTEIARETHYRKLGQESQQADLRNGSAVDRHRAMIELAVERAPLDGESEPTGSSADPNNSHQQQHQQEHGL